MFSIGNRICVDHWTSVLDTACGMLGQSRGTSDKVPTRGGGFWDDLEARSAQTHFRARNAPYALKDPSKSLKSQQMRAPSERTKGICH
jgi:hypothetical protein